MSDDLIQRIQKETNQVENNNIMGLVDIISAEFRPVLVKDVYSELKDRVKEMVIIQKKIEKTVKKEDASKLYKFLMQKILMLKQPKMGELFDLQLDNVSGLNAILSRINLESRQELSSLVKYSKLVSNNFSESLESRKKKKIRMSKLKLLCEEASQALKNMKKIDPKYFVIEEGIKDLKRDIKEDLHTFKLANDAAVDLGQEREFLVVMEDLLRVSVYTCEKISSKSKRIENHIKRTKKVYITMNDQQQSVELLHTAVSTLTSYTLQVHQTLGKGLREMSKTANNQDLLSSFYLTANGNLSGILDSVKKASEMDPSERIIDKYLGNKRD